MEKVDKTWGWEHWFANSELYCGKLLYVKPGLWWSSNGAYHYHKIKDETFLVIESKLTLEYYDGIIHRSITLEPYDSFHIKPGIKHRFTCKTDDGCKFIEASTQHFEEDSYRCELKNGIWIEKS